MNGPYTQHTLDNGLRVVIEVMPDVRSAAAGFLVLTGARDETRAVAGVSHFLEHMMFKGTTRRTWRNVTIDFDRLGSTYNAYTSEDRTIYYGWVRRVDLPAQIELLADMLRSTLPEEELQTERNVILEEIAMSKDHLENVAIDFLQEKVFADHPLAWPILGYEETVRALTREQMWEYFERRYAPGNIVLVVAGKVTPAEIVDLAEKHCGGWKQSGVCSPSSAPQMRSGTDVLQTDRFKQQMLALTFRSVGASDRRAETASAAATILGGANSRFFWNIMQAGLSPRTSVAHLEYADCGALVLYAVCQPEKCAQLYAAMRKEADKICSQLVQPHEVDRVKIGRRTSLAVESEAPYYRLTQIMDDMQYHGAPRTVEQMLAEVDAVSADSIHEYFATLPINVGGHLTSVGPRDWPNTNGSIDQPHLQGP